MNITSLQDKLTRGMGTAARKMGTPTTVYRPSGFSQPLGEHRRVITIPAAFEPRGQASGSGGTVSPVWHGVFDASYTRPADYLRSTDGTYFIGSQIAGSAILCILTNRVIGMSRPALTPQGGYSGIQSQSEITLVDWPASLIQPRVGANGDASANRTFAAWTVLLPILPAAPCPTDVMTDDLGSTYVVDVAEQNSLGWCLHVRQIGA